MWKAEYGKTDVPGDPNIDSITVNKVGKVRRAKLYYLRNLTGKKARIAEKRAALTAE